MSVTLLSIVYATLVLLSTRISHLMEDRCHAKSRNKSRDRGRFNKREQKVVDAEQQRRLRGEEEGSRLLSNVARLVAVCVRQQILLINRSKTTRTAVAKEACFE